MTKTAVAVAENAAALVAVRERQEELSSAVDKVRAEMAASLNSMKVTINEHQEAIQQKLGMLLDALPRRAE